MSSGLVSFGSYTFANLQEFQDNFLELDNRLIGLPGVDGGFDAYGIQTAPSKPGSILMRFMILSSTRAGMDAKRDLVTAMVESGLRKLIYQPTDPVDATRWTWARVNRIDMPENKGAHTDLWQPVAVTFDCPDPKWYVDNAAPTWALGDGSLIGQTGLKIGDGSDYKAASGLTTTHTLTNNGTTIALAHVTIEPQTAQTCENPKIQRLEGSYIADEVGYTGVLAALSILDIDPATLRVTYNAQSAWNNFSYRHPSLFRLMPGSNSIKILFKNVGDAATIRFFYADTYR